MPELPDVQNFTDFFNQHCLRKKIRQAECREPKLLPNVNPSVIQEALTGTQFKKAFRQGKYMIAPLESQPKKLILHFGMTGTLDYGPTEEMNITRTRYAPTDRPLSRWQPAELDQQTQTWKNFPCRRSRDH